jgi:phosphoribosylanthranilate isomerase
MQSAAEAEMAIETGALAIGLVGAMPNGPGPIADGEIRDIAAHVRARHGDKIWTTLLTSRIDADAIADHVAATGVNSVQIADMPEARTHAHLRRAHPGLRILQVIHVEDDSAIEAARAAGETADFILLDSGKPSAAVRTLGGAGDVHDWQVSRRVALSCGRPVFLAGGLNPDNAVAAWREVRPFGLDVCSGLRDAARAHALNPEKLGAFAAALRKAAPAA